jgi:hypothetical protein
MDEDSKLKRERKRAKRGKENIVGNMGDLATAVGQGFYVADAWGGGTCSAVGSASAAVTQRTIVAALTPAKSWYLPTLAS